MFSLKLKKYDRFGSSYFIIKEHYLARMKILQITSRLPYPPIDGGSIEIYNNIKYLALRGHDITLISLVNKRKKVSELKKYCELITIKKNTGNHFLGYFLNIFIDTPYTISKYHSNKVKKEIRELLKKDNFDIIILNQLHTAYYGNFIKKEYNLPIVLREQNTENIIMKRFYKNQNNIFIKFYAYLQYKKLYKYESKICEIFDRCFMITKIDEKTIKDMNSNVKTNVVPAGVDISYFYPLKFKEEEFSLVSVASMNWLPNVEAIEWFCKEVQPLIKKEIQKVKLYIVGINPPNNIKSLANNNVIVTGFVEDVRKYLAKGQVFIVPLKTGSGMRIKILNALAMGKAIVSTSIGCEGIDVVDGKNIYIADNKEEFAEKVVFLLNNKDERDRIGKEGLKLVKEKYQWEKIAEDIETEFKKIINENNILRSRKNKLL
ncbi:MAG TPA: glycosyltransferase [Candidatus Atribacteria bacterium]|nr:glycosyltransferase [Candidatus Atribacteria bacterium]